LTECPALRPGPLAARPQLITRRIQQVRFRDADRPLDTFDFDFNKKMNRALIHDLATGRFIEQREDVLFLGPPEPATYCYTSLSF
jgi:DNA replication protein DnaC